MIVNYRAVQLFVSLQGTKLAHKLYSKVAHKLNSAHLRSNITILQAQ